MNNYEKLRQHAITTGDPPHVLAQVLANLLGTDLRNDVFWVDGPRMERQVVRELDGDPFSALPLAPRWNTIIGYGVHGWPESRTLVESRQGVSRNTYGSIDYDLAGNPEVVVVDGDSPQDRIETHTTWISDSAGVLWVPQERWTRAWHWPDGAMRTVERGTFAYDGGALGSAPVEGHLTFQEVMAGQPGASLGSDTLTWSFVRDDRGNVTQSTDPMGNVQSWTWDLFGEGVRGTRADVDDHHR